MKQLPNFIYRAGYISGIILVYYPNKVKKGCKKLFSATGKKPHKTSL